MVNFRTFHDDARQPKNTCCALYTESPHIVYLFATPANFRLNHKVADKSALVYNVEMTRILMFLLHVCQTRCWFQCWLHCVASNCHRKSRRQSFDHKVFGRIAEIVYVWQSIGSVRFQFVLKHVEEIWTTLFAFRVIGFSSVFSRNRRRLERVGFTSYQGRLNTCGVHLRHVRAGHCPRPSASLCEQFVPPRTLHEYWLIIDHRARMVAASKHSTHCTGARNARRRDAVPSIHRWWSESI